MFALTPRLTLRPGWPEDAPALSRAIGHAAVVRNLAHAPWPYLLRDAESFLSLPRGADEPRFLIFERHGTHSLVGGMAVIRDGTGGELGYWLTPAAWGRGYATEAGRAVIAMARDTLRLHRLTAHPFTDNPASARVLTKLGFRETGRGRMHSLARGETADCVELALDLAGNEQDPPLPIAA